MVRSISGSLVRIQPLYRDKDQGYGQDSSGKAVSGLPKNRTEGNRRVKLINKPWGYELWWAYSEHFPYMAKFLSIKPNCRLSLQFHSQKHETIFVMRGTLRLTYNGKDTFLYPGDVQTIYPKDVHRFAAHKSPVRLIEVSTNDWMDRDTVRLEDDYGRSKKGEANAEADDPSRHSRKCNGHVHAVGESRSAKHPQSKSGRSASRFRKAHDRRMRGA